MTRAFLTQDHMTTETPADTAETGIASISELLDDRHQTTPDHEAHQEVGGAPEPDAVPPISAQPAQAETPPAVAANAPNFDELANDPKFQEWLQPRMPKWSREAIKKANERAQEAVRAAPQQAYRPEPQPSAEDMDRPVTRAELAAWDEARQLRESVSRSKDMLVDKHGDDTFADVQAWLDSKTTPNGNPMENWALSQRNPWLAAHEQYQREKIAEEIGTDPVAYKARLEEKIRAEYEARAVQPQSAPSAPTMQRPAPPLAASTARSAAPDRDAGGRFTGSAPIRTRNRF